MQRLYVHVCIYVDVDVVSIYVGLYAHIYKQSQALCIMCRRMRLRVHSGELGSVQMGVFLFIGRGLTGRSRVVITRP